VIIGRPARPAFGASSFTIQDLTPLTADPIDCGFAACHVTAIGCGSCGWWRCGFAGVVVVLGVEIRGILGSDGEGFVAKRVRSLTKTRLRIVLAFFPTGRGDYGKNPFRLRTRNGKAASRRCARWCTGAHMPTNCPTIIVSLFSRFIQSDIAIYGNWPHTTKSRKSVPGCRA
jgi:hypothetical protein